MTLKLKKAFSGPVVFVRFTEIQTHDYEQISLVYSVSCKRNLHATSQYDYQTNELTNKLFMYGSTVWNYLHWIRFV